MLRYDIETLAYLALIGVCLVLFGALLTAGPVTIEQRGTVLGGIIVILAGIGWRASHRHHKDDDDD